MKILQTVKTIKNNEIQLFSEKSQYKNAKNILFLGVMHGEEPQGNYLIKRFIDKIQKEHLIFKNNVFCIPCLNPDGMEINSRGNSNNTDLNRNFNTQNYEITVFDDGTNSGKEANSELETKFLSDIVIKYNFDAILSFHAPFEIVNYDGNAKEIALKVSQITGYPVQADIGYSTPGSFGTFCGIERNIPIITLELSDKLSNDILWEQNEELFNYFANL